MFTFFYIKGSYYYFFVYFKKPRKKTAPVDNQFIIKNYSHYNIVQY